MAVAVFGEALFDLIEAPAGDIIACIGGSPFNVARSFVRQGVPCTYVAPFQPTVMAKNYLIMPKQKACNYPQGTVLNYSRHWH